jgi:hypothetical protein
MMILAGQNWMTNHIGLALKGRTINMPKLIVSVKEQNYLNQKMPNKMTLLPIVLKRKVYRDL